MLVLLFLILIPSLVQNIEYVRTYYTKELLLLWDKSGRYPSNLNVHKNSNTLFFCYNIPLNYDSHINFYNIDTKETESIRRIRKGCANTVDQEYGDVYLGGLKGIYKYNIETKIPKFYAEKGTHIESLFYNERLYYIRYPDRNIFVELDDGVFAHVAEFMDLNINHFHISKEGRVFFDDGESLYIYAKNETHWDLKGLRKVHTVNAISEDNNGVVYVCTIRGVFKVINNGLQKFINEDNIVGLTADRDNNLILADDRSIYRLLRNEENDYSE